MSQEHNTDSQQPAGAPEVGPPASQRQVALPFIGLIAGPLLALVCAVMGLILILSGKTIAGVIFLVIPTQLFLFLGLWAYRARQKENQ